MEIPSTQSHNSKPQAWGGQPKSQRALRRGHRLGRIQGCSNGGYLGVQVDRGGWNSHLFQVPIHAGACKWRGADIWVYSVLSPHRIRLYASIDILTKQNKAKNAAHL